MKERNGSALLIVLGMLAFMVISGVAFSAFMRSSRQPSSFTRRAVTTRQLAKAALAEAIDQIDRAVANDPHPGVRNNQRIYTESTRTIQNTQGDDVTAFDPDTIDNFWAERILIGQGQSSQPTTSGGLQYKGDGVAANGNTYYPRFVDPSETVPVLTMEALAYLPPSIVNEVRYYGQQTPTAGWQTFDFDAGRYAYIAVDVSDYFDVNRICPEYARSSDPAMRVTLAHIFETHQSGSSQISGWNSFIEQYRTFNSTDGTFSFSSLPFISLADFNLAWGTLPINGMLNPFVQYVQGDGKNGFYSTTAQAQLEKYGEMCFVTDSLMATRPERESKTDDGNQILDLADDSNQIFKETFLEMPQDNRTFALLNSQLNSGVGQRLVKNRIPYVTMFELSDYLDCDRIPTSLGIPSVERVPMICGIKPQLASSQFALLLDVNRNNNGNDTSTQTVMGNPTAGTKGERHMTRTVSWKIDSASLAKAFMGGVLQTLVVYPFRNHEQESENSWFQMDGKIQLFLSSDEMRLRTGNQSDLLHWGANGTATSGGTVGLGSSKVIMNLPLDPQTIPLQTVPIVNQEVAQLANKLVYDDVKFDLTKFAADIQSALNAPNGDLLSVQYDWDEEEATPGSGNYVIKGNNTISHPDPSTDPIPGGYATPTIPVSSPATLYALMSDGTVDPDFQKLNNNNVAGFKKTLYLNMAVTLRVISSQNDVLGASSGTKTVDMVPATIFDDNDVNNIGNGSGPSALYSVISGEAGALMNFKLANPCTLQLASPDPPQTIASPSGFMVSDPRYNHAPENWKALSNFSKQGWYSEAQNLFKDRDGDLFMASSDQNYMQSVHEFAFLPRLADLSPSGSSLGGYLPGYPSGYPSGSGCWKSLGEKSPVDEDWMWKTYDLFGRYSSDGDDFEGLGLDYGEGYTAGGKIARIRGLRANPYSNLDSVLLAAFANTPHDWRVASNNEDENPASSAMNNADTFNKQHAWNEYATGASLCWDEIETLADRYRAAVKAGFAAKGAGGDFDNSDWCLQNVSDSYSDVLDDAFRAFFATATGTDAERYLCGLKLDNDCSSVYSVDKKFLYGYWKSCFAARQQLFLVFFRAEPMMLGGGVAGVTPPQLGARGVALVWRDPYDPNERKPGSGNVTRNYPTQNGNGSYIPHQTRVLFYKQFE